MSPAIAYPVGVEVGLVYVITGPDGTRAVINDPTDPDFVGYLNADGGVTGLERAGVRASSDSLPEADGSVAGINRYEGLAFTLQGFIPPDSPAGTDTWIGRQDRLLRATDAMRADAYVNWTPSSAGAGAPIPLRLGFRQAQPTRITGRRPKAFIVAGQAERNVVEAANPNLITVAPDLTAAYGGMQSPLVSPLTSNPAPSAGVTITNRGRSTAWPVLTIHGPCTNPSVTNATLGRTLAFAYTLTAGDTLTIDTNPSRRSVLLNGVTNRYSALIFAASTWWGLASGPNDVRLGFATYSAGAGVDVLYRDAWG